MIIDIQSIPKLINCIYKITSPSGRVYVGSTKNLYKRISAYKTLNCKSQVKIFKSLNKYGVENHIFEVLEQDLKVDNLNERETFWGLNFKVLTRDKGLNSKLPNWGDIKDTISEETREKISSAHKGKILSEEHKNNISRGLSGKKRTEEFRKGVSERNSKRVLSEESRAKLSRSLKDYYANPDNALAIREANEKMRDAVKVCDKTKQIESASKIVLDTQTGVFYNSSAELGRLNNMVKTRLLERLNRRLKSSNRFIYV